MRKFDQKSYDKYDTPAKVAFSGFLVARGCEVAEGTQYGTDLICRRPDGSELLLDVECRTSPRWQTSGAFPFGTVEFAMRREKTVERCPEVVFGMTNRDFTSFVVVSGHVLSAIGEKVPKEVRGKTDCFISVPLTCAVTGVFY